MTLPMPVDADDVQTPSGPRAWLVLTLEKRSHGGNDGYDDAPSEHYSWDDTVPIHSRLAKGDRLVLWNSKTLLGATVIQDIDHGTTDKPVYKCPHCGRAKIKAATEAADGLCYVCKKSFKVPTTIVKSVKTYRSRHDLGYVALDGALDGKQLRQLTVQPLSQHSLRPLRWNDFVSTLADPSLLDSLQLLEKAAASIQGGHKTAVVRVRVGQSAFRASLLAELGPVCAMTGAAPRAALEAGHLYSFAATGEHYEKGGLLLRRDIHRLFDAGQLAVDPKTLTIDVAPSIRDFPEYGRLHGQPLAVKVTTAHCKWLARHWRQFRPNCEKAS